MFGVFVVTPTAGWLIDAYGWELVFYFFGITSIVWGVLWELVVFDSPDNHPRITEREREFIKTSLGNHNIGNKEKMRVRA
jgi:MFS family permease